MQQDADERARQRDLVRRGYDAISRSYGHDPERTALYGEWIDELGRHLLEGAQVLDLGCGTGVPVSRMLVDAGFAVTGVDISDVQIDRGRELVPEAEFVVGDMAVWECDPARFDAVVSLYALIHVPLADQRTVIPDLAARLAPGGMLLAIVGHQRWTGVADYLGAPMFWDHADDATYVEWLEAAGFRVHWQRFVADGDSGHTLVLAEAAGPGS